MPLPTAPSKRAALLSLQDFNVPARPKTKSSPPKQKSFKSSELAEAVPLPIAQPQPALKTTTTPETPAKRRPEPVSTTRAITRPKKRKDGPCKLFVLDTNVLLHDPSCLFRFEEHDVFLPMIVLEELDGHKKGMTEVARTGCAGRTPGIRHQHRITFEFDGSH